jgi:hypothetical protein
MSRQGFVDAIHVSEVPIESFSVGTSSLESFSHLQIAHDVLPSPVSWDKLDILSMGPTDQWDLSLQ